MGDWVPPDGRDLYDGKVWCGDGEAAWVFPRRHERGGWAVEVRRGDPDGPIAERVWQPHHDAADAFVQQVRSRLAHSTVDAVASGSVPPPAPKGIVVVHGPLLQRYAWHEASVDGGPRARTCCAIWVEPGLRTVAWSMATSRERAPEHVGALPVQVVADETVHVGLLSGRLMRPRSYGAKQPFLHRSWRW